MSFFGGKKPAAPQTGPPQFPQLPGESPGAYFHRLAAWNLKNEQAKTAAATLANTTPAPPPSTTASASNAYASAKSVAERQRKRAASGAGRTSPGGALKGPGASLQPRTLLGYALACVAVCPWFS